MSVAADISKDGAAAGFSVSEREGRRVVALEGNWSIRNLAAAEERLRDVPQSGLPTVLDLSRVHQFDTAGAYLVSRFSHRQSGSGGVEFRNVQDRHATLIDVVSGLRSEADPSVTGRPNILIRMAESVGRSAYDLYNDVLTGLHVLGASLAGEGSAKAGRRNFGITAVTAQLDQMAVRAVPIVGLMSFLIGAIIAQQGAFQLRFVAGAGSEIFAVDLVSILLLREVAVMLTAIMVAGRSGSAITAELGSMRMREELDALKVIGLDPISTLVFPRLVAIVFALLILTIVSSLFALLGGAIVLYLYADLPFAIQIFQLSQAIDFTTIFAGIIKAPFMAIIIGVVA